MSSLSPEGRKLLDASRTAGGPSSAQRVAMKRAVLAAVLVPGAAAAATGTAVGGAKATGLALIVKLGIVVAAVGLGSAVVWNGMRSQPAEPHSMKTPVMEAPLMKPPFIPSEVEGRKSAVPITKLEPVRSPDPVVNTEPTIQPVPFLPAVDEATLSREIGALSGAMSAVDSKSYGVALEQLTTYHAGFPAGALQTEAGVLEVLALCGLGRVDEARTAAASLPANNPAVRRLERSCIAARK